MAFFIIYYSVMEKKTRKHLEQIYMKARYHCANNNCPHTCVSKTSIITQSHKQKPHAMGKQFEGISTTFSMDRILQNFKSGYYFHTNVLFPDTPEQI